MKSNILLILHNLLSSGKKIAMVTNISVTGSSPGKEGDIMGVMEDGSIVGTIGGGTAEALAIDMAKGCLMEDKNKEYEFKLTEEGIGTLCGGIVKGYIHILKPIPRIVVFGGGHIGKLIYDIGKNLNFSLLMIDDREEFANNKRFPEAEVICKETHEAMKDILVTQNDYIVIVTRGHKDDKKALKEVIDLDAKYIGLIGSKKKIIQIKDELLKEGISQNLIDRVYAPIGLDISDSTPEEIALGILSEILIIKNNGTLNHRRDKK